MGRGLSNGNGNRACTSCVPQRRRRNRWPSPRRKARTGAHIPSGPGGSAPLVM